MNEKFYKRIEDNNPQYSCDWIVSPFVVASDVVFFCRIYKNKSVKCKYIRSDTVGSIGKRFGHVLTQQKNRQQHAIVVVRMN